MGKLKGGSYTLPQSTSPSTTVLVEENKGFSNRAKILTAASIFFGNIVFGCVFNTYGPAITSLQDKYGTDDAGISKTFTILTGMHMIGGVSAGFLYKYLNRQLSVVCIFSTLAGLMILTPHCPTLITFFATVTVVGFCCGAYDTAQFVWMMEMMQDKCPPYVQGQHFFYAVGSMLAPTVMAPFLDDDVEDDEDGENFLTEGTTTSDTDFTSPSDFTSNYVSGSFRNFTDFSEDDGINATTIIPEEIIGTESNLNIPFTIVGLLSATAAIYQLTLFMCFRYSAPPPQEELEKPDNNNAIDIEGGKSPTPSKRMNLEPEPKPCIGSWSWPKLRIVALSGCFFGAAASCVICSFQFFPKFVQNIGLDMSESESAYVLTGMSLAFSISRGIAIVLIFKIPPQYILCVNIVLMISANSLLLFFAKNSVAILWVSSVLFGIAFSSTYASFCVFIERYLRFTDFIGSIMIVSGVSIASAYPLIIGSSMDENPIVLTYALFVSIALLTFAFCTLFCITRKDKRRY